MKKTNKITEKEQKESLVLYNKPDFLIKNIKIKSIEQAMSSDFPTLLTLKINHGEGEVVKFLIKFILEINLSTNVARTMEASQIKYTAYLILEDFPFLKISDIILIFRRINSGIYGQFYNSLSTSKIIDVFKLYFDERCLSAENQSIQDHQKIQHEERYTERVSTSKNPPFISQEIYNHLKNKNNE